MSERIERTVRPVRSAGGRRRWHVIIPVVLGGASALLFALYPRSSSAYEVVGSVTPPPAVNGTRCSPLTQEDVDSTVAAATRGTGATPTDVADRLQIRQLDDVGRFQVSYSHPHAYQASRVVRQTLATVVARSCGRTVTNILLAVESAEKGVAEASAERRALELEAEAVPRDGELRARLDDAVAIEAAAEEERRQVLDRVEDVARLTRSVESKSIVRVGESRRLDTGTDLVDRIVFVAVVALGATLLAAVIRGLRRNVDEAPALADAG
ncbi:MAG: hypothetical protein H0U26_05945 [Acidimicrobiia bacterium]|nr:hypothetical protein [Acidimicrobiia bacterium]